MNDNPSHPPRLSWDVERNSAPERPRFEKSLNAAEKIPRPRRVIYAFVLVVLAAGIYAVMTALAAVNYDQVRGSLASVLATELQDEYTPDDMQLAVNVLLGAVWIGGLALTLLHLLSAQSIMLKRSGGGRVVLIITTILFLPVAVVAATLRNASELDLAISAVGAFLLIIAAVMVSLPRVSLWIRQPDEPEKRPLITPLDD